MLSGRAPVPPRQNSSTASSIRSIGRTLRRARKIGTCVSEITFGSKSGGVGLSLTHTRCESGSSVLRWRAYQINPPNPVSKFIARRNCLLGHLGRRSLSPPSRNPKTPTSRRLPVSLNAEMANSWASSAEDATKRSLFRTYCSVRVMLPPAFKDCGGDVTLAVGRPYGQPLASPENLRNHIAARIDSLTGTTLVVDDQLHRIRATVPHEPRRPGLDMGSGRMHPC